MVKVWRLWNTHKPPITGGDFVDFFDEKVAQKEFKKKGGVMSKWALNPMKR